MKMNEGKKIKLKSIFCITRLVFLLSFMLYIVIMGTTSFGWFHNNKNANGNGLAIEVASDSFSFDSIEYFVVTEKSNDNRYTFVPLPKDETDKYFIPTYDPQGIEYSEYLPMVIVKINYKITDGANLGLYFTGEKHLENKYNSETNYTSNVLSIKVAETTENPSIVKDSTTNTNVVSFTQFTGTDITYRENAEKDNSVELPIISSIPNDSREIWLIVEYNTDVIDHICKKISMENIGSSNSNTIINYQPDTKFSVK